MSWDQDERLVRSVARSAVAAAAPAELPSFEQTCTVFFAAPRRVRRNPRRRGDLLGFGAETIVEVATPAALLITTEVLKHLAETYVRDGVRSVRRRFRRRRGAADAQLPKLDGEQLGELREVAKERAAALEVPAELAELIADGIVAELATQHREED